MAEGGQVQTTMEMETEHRVERFARATAQRFPQLLESLHLYQHMMKRVHNKNGVYFDWNRAEKDDNVAFDTQDAHLASEFSLLELHPDPTKELVVVWTNIFAMFLTVELFIDLIAKKGTPALMDDWEEGLPYLLLWTFVVDKLDTTMVEFIDKARTVNDMEGLEDMVDSCCGVVGETRAELDTTMVEFVDEAKTGNVMEEVAEMVDTCCCIVVDTRDELFRQINEYLASKVIQ